MACLYKRGAVFHRQRDASDDVKGRILAARRANPLDYSDNAVHYIRLINGKLTKFRLRDYPLDANSGNTMSNDGVEPLADSSNKAVGSSANCWHNTTTHNITANAVVSCEHQ